MIHKKIKFKNKISVQEYSKHKIVKENNKYIIMIPYFIFFWKPLQIKLLSNSIIDFYIAAEFDSIEEVNDFIKYKIYNIEKLKKVFNELSSKEN